MRPEQQHQPKKFNSNVHLPERRNLRLNKTRAFKSSRGDFDVNGIDTRGVDLDEHIVRVAECGFVDFGELVVGRIAVGGTRDGEHSCD